MDFAAFVEGPLLQVVLLIFVLTLIIRSASFVLSVFKGKMRGEIKDSHILGILARVFVPFHKAVLKKPGYAVFRYIFHICLFAVPIWLSGHISLWEESRLEWVWWAMPEPLADVMTIMVLILALLFIFRRFLLKNIRPRSSLSDFLIIFFAACPFLTGFFLSHGTLDSIPAIGNNIWTIHLLSGEIMILLAAFLFCRTRMNVSKCTGCASCELACPTGTLETADIGQVRHFNYSHYQCICCGSCVETCPEDAAELRHEFSPVKFLHFFKKKEIRAVELEACERCGALFVPEPLMEKIHKNFTDDYLKFCSYCRKVNMGDFLKTMTLGYRKSGR